ncbi:MAG TPA: hypothetical protein VE981_14170 [Planctomycetota bacterium]|nr:hypothetical protein [Planctomycetota bacterium]
MTFCMALVAALLVQEPADDLRKEFEKLKRQNIDLQERLSLLEQTAVEDAQTIQRLRQVVKLLESNGPSDAPASGPKNPGLPTPKPNLPGPLQSIKGKVVYVDAKNNFITLGIGKKDKVEVGYRFEIYRETYENGGESRLTKLGSGEVEKFMGQDSMTKVVISEGTISEMKPDDMAVAVRKISDLPPGKKEEEVKTAPLPPSPEAIKEGIFTITGRAGSAANAGYVINYGTIQGAHQTQLLWAYSDGKFKAKLRIDKVEKNHSIAFVVDNAMELPPATGDQVYVRELNKSLTGKVALSDEKRNVLAVDLRQRDGIKPGDHCEVRRLGQKLGTVLITEVQNWGSWARPEGDLKIEQIMKGDIVELIQEKQ